MSYKVECGKFGFVRLNSTSSFLSLYFSERTGSGTSASWHGRSFS